MCRLRRRQAKLNACLTRFFADLATSQALISAQWVCRTRKNWDVFSFQESCTDPRSTSRRGHASMLAC